MMQTPFLKQAIEQEIQVDTQQKIANCISSMENQLRSRGYNVNIAGSRNGLIEIKPGMISVAFNITMTLQKGNAPAVIIPSARFKTEFNSGDLAIPIQNHL
jgi:hypothetical protein